MHVAKAMRYLPTYNFKNKKALIRTDFNVPLDAHCQVTDSIRIDRTIPTIRKVLEDGGAAILVSHLGRPKQGYENTLSLQHLVPYLSSSLHTKVVFAKDCIGSEAQQKARQLRPGQVLLLENIRFYPEEEKGDKKFAQALAQLGDVYINDAFGVIHRAHASIKPITPYFKDKLAGYLLQAEMQHADQLLAGAQKPFTAIIGGAKISDKMEAIQCLLGKVDNLLLGGGVANTFQQALGGQLGDSLVETDQLQLALSLVKQAQDNQVQFVLPTDARISNQLNDQAQTKLVASNAIPGGSMALDIGPQTMATFHKLIAGSQTILWAGPIGAFEYTNFRHGTQAVAAAVVAATSQGAFSFIGGGDSAMAIKSLGYSNQVSYISTGGGALLAYIANKNLPGIQALAT